MNIEEIDKECESILSNCKTFVNEVKLRMLPQEKIEEIDTYGFLISIGSNIGKIKKLIHNGTT